MIRFVFLDIDGVLNHKRWLQAIAAGQAKRPTVRLPPSGREQEVLVDPAKVELLNLLVRPGIEWVLSSMWRGDGGDQARAVVQAILEQLGWRGKLIGSTPILRSLSTSIHADHSRVAQATRGGEIMAWLEANGVQREQVGKDVRIAILDDDDDIEPVKKHWVAVDDGIGLTSENALRAWSMLDEVVIVVDEFVPRPTAKLRCFRAGSSHLMANGCSDLHLEALHKMARRIGLKREYFQQHETHPHYDLTTGRRAAAVRAGAVEVSARAMLTERRRLRSI